MTIQTGATFPGVAAVGAVEKVGRGGGMAAGEADRSNEAMKLVLLLHIDRDRDVRGTRNSRSSCELCKDT